MAEAIGDATILICDGNDERRRDLAALCTSGGYATKIVGTVEEGVELVLAQPGRFAIAVAACAAGQLPAVKLRAMALGHAAVVVMAESAGDLDMLTQAYDIGAAAYLEFRHMQKLAVLKSLELVLLGERVFPSKFVVFQAREHLDSGLVGKRGNQLSARESEILAFVSSGESNRAIAQKLSISEGTVKGHLRAITRKLGVPNRTKAAIWALEHGFAPGRGITTSAHGD
jgi:two-component system nitrate/nitrite response regulator NarL